MASERIAAFACFLRLCQQPQLAVPVCFQGVGHQAVIRVHAKIAAAGELGFVARPLLLLLTQTVGFVQPRLQLLLHGQCDFKRDGGNCIDEDVPDCLIDGSARNVLADRFAVFDALALAHVIWNQLPAPAVIAHRHALAAAATDHQSLQPGGAFPWWTLAPVLSVSLTVVVETALVLFILVPPWLGPV